MPDARMILLTGGSACGKSSFAEALCTELPLPRYYIAAMRPFGDGSEQKIARHRRLRSGKGFETFERYTDLRGLVLPERGTVLLECICNLTANEMFDEEGRWQDPFDAVTEGVEALRRQSGTLIVITNDVGSDGETYDPGTQAYIAAIGRINAWLARQADVVCELVCGIPLVRKGELPQMQGEEHGKGGEGMILIIGGEGSGKRSFARSLGYTDADMADGVLDGRPVLYHLERMILAEPELAEEILPELLQKEVVICDEVGSGVIPADRAGRTGREAAGRLCIHLAQRAQTVVRMVCGIPAVLKGDERKRMRSL